MKSFLSASVIFGLSILLSSCGPAQQEETIDRPDTPGQDTILLQILDSVYKQFPATRGIVAFVHAPEQGISWQAAVGCADSASHRELQPNDPALIASITKIYMGATTLRLIEDTPLDMESPIATYLPPTTVDMLKRGGYKPDSIQVRHLLSNTSGLFDYVETKTFQDRSVEQPDYHWTREEQIKLAIEKGKPYGEPGEHFHYSDLNFLLLAEIFEVIEKKPWYQVVRDKLNFEKHQLNATWWDLQEDKPELLPALVHQYATSFQVDSYSEHGSFDNYGGGGIACTAEDLSRFTWLLFNGKLFKDIVTLSLLFEKIPTPEQNDPSYLMSIMRWDTPSGLRFGHGGFWGTMTQFLPELNASVSVFVMERDEWPRTIEIIDAVESRFQ